MDLATKFSLELNESTFLTTPRSDGSLSIYLIGVSIDHGAQSAITGFVNSQLSNPVVAAMLVGGRMRWDTDGVVSLLLLDEDDTKQALMRDFLFLSMVTGRFQPEEEIQRRIWATDGILAPFPQVPQAWWDRQNLYGEDLRGEEFMAFYMAWLQERLGG